MRDWSDRVTFRCIMFIPNFMKIHQLFQNLLWGWQSHGYNTMGGPISEVQCSSYRNICHIVAASDGELPISPILGMIVGAALTFISVVLLVVVKFRRSRSNGDQDGRQPHVEKHSGPNSTSLLHSTPSGKELGPSGVRDCPGDEKDPDIIPAKFGEFLFTTKNCLIYMYYHVIPTTMQAIFSRDAPFCRK
jgi:hypothetical protein